MDEEDGLVGVGIGSSNRYGFQGKRPHRERRYVSGGVGEMAVAQFEQSQDRLRFPQTL